MCIRDSSFTEGTGPVRTGSYRSLWGSRLNSVLCGRRFGIRACGRGATAGFRSVRSGRSDELGVDHDLDATLRSEDRGYRAFQFVDVVSAQPVLRELVLYRDTDGGLVDALQVRAPESGLELLALPTALQGFLNGAPEVTEDGGVRGAARRGLRRGFR